ncbi:NIC-domain-containing protein [Hortaea werneckii]|nr:NIC-domain-containing protein [Hortaea werneckii]KAI7245145.1 NIC-domain-containing protein [Hortaea werneckii]
MSLFGSTTPKPNGGGGGLFGGSSGGGSLFGQPQTSQPASSGGGGGSLFGSTTTTSAPSGGGLFGNSTTTSAPSGGGLFGGTSQPSGTSLFGNNNNNNTSNTNNNATSQPGQAGNSLFGNSSTKPFQPAGSLFASTANQGTQQPQQNANASLFGNDILPSNQHSQPSLVERSYTANAAAPQPAYYHALLDKGNKRMAEDYNALPQLQLGLGDISRKVRNIGQCGPSAGEAKAPTNNHKSAYLLGASGVNVGQSLRDIEELANSTAARPQTATDSPDFSSFSGVKEYLGQQHRNQFEQMIQRRIDSAHAEFDEMINEQLHDVDWDGHMNRIYEHFGFRKPQNEGGSAGDSRLGETGGFGRTSRRSRAVGASALGKSYGLQGMWKSIIGTPGPKAARQSVFGDVAEKLPADGMRPAPEDRVQRVKQEKYAGKVMDLNVARLQERVYPILHRFSEVENEPSNDDTSMLINAYKALVQITGEDATKENAADPGAVKERQYATDYLDDNPNARGRLDIRKRIIGGSRRFLEKLFHTQLEATVAKNPREANVGGIPTSVAKAKGYVRVRAARKELAPDLEILQDINGDYCWAVLFYMLRSGLHKEALEYVQENAAAFRQIDRAFTRYLQAYVASEDHRLPADLQQSINNAYSARERLAPEDSIDPYRMMCYKVIGRCDLQRRSLDNITNDMMDWLWLQFALARDYSRVDEYAHEAFGLEELRESIKQIGNRYFGPNSDIANAPTTFFFMQILAGMFEKAVADLYPHNYVSATHFAIALDYYGLLRVSGDINSDDLLGFTTRQQPQIAFGSMVGLYTRDFRTANATWAVDYLCLICLNADLGDDLGKAQREICHQALIETVLETREFAQLLGDVRSDGVRIKGTVEQRLKLIKLENERDFLKQITIVAARTAEEQSRVTDAALLFHLAEDYDKVIQVVNEAVSVALTTELGEQPTRLTPLKPRTQQLPDGRQEVVAPQGSSLSLTSIDDPVQLARNITDLYASSTMYTDRIAERTISCCRVLMNFANARAALEKGNWSAAIDHITASRVLPTDADGNLSTIRGRAQNFNTMAIVISRTIGHVMLWTIVACSNHADRMRATEFETGAQQDMLRQCSQIAKDVMVFAGLIRFKLPGKVWETLAAAGQELGAF